MRQAVGRILRVAKTEVIGLDTAVPLPRLAAVAGLNEWQPPAGRVAGLQVRIHRDGELVLGGFRPNPVERFSVLGIGFPPHRVADPGLGHQVAFIRGVNKHAGAVNLAILHDDLPNARALPGDGSQALLKIDRRAGFAEHLEQELFRHARLEGPHGGVRPFEFVRPGTARPVLDVIGACLEPPRLIPRVMLRHAPVKLAGQAADDPFVADVGRAQSA